jgi:hypothetical protein
MLQNILMENQKPDLLKKNLTKHFQAGGVQIMKE